jgi:hypothetical protein
MQSKRRSNISRNVQKLPETQPQYCHVILKLLNHFSYCIIKSRVSALKQAPFCFTQAVNFGIIRPTRCTVYFQLISINSLHMFRAALLLIIRRYCMYSNQFHSDPTSFQPIIISIAVYCIYVVPPRRLRWSSG